MGVIAKYKFNNTLEANLLPEFNIEFTSDLYTVTDEVNGDITTRTIESDSLPTLMRFGVAESSVATERSKSLLEIISLDISNCTHLYHNFRYCVNLTTVNGLIVHNGIKNLDNAFGNCNSLEFVDTSNWDTSNVSYMSHMLTNCYNLTSLDVSNWDTGNVTGMNSMFYSCSSLTSIDVSNWNTSNVISMGSMFSYCHNLTSLDVSNWDTRNVTNMQSMFYECTNLTSLDVSNFNTSNVTNMSQMFSCCTNLTSLDVSNFNTSNVTDMNGMFGDCYALISIEGINNFDVRKVQDFGNIFISCHTLQYLDLHNWTTSTDAWYQGMFAYCNNLHTIDISNFIFLGSSGNRRLLFKESQNIKYIKCNNIATIDIIKSQLPTKSSTSQGTIICKSDITNLDITSLQSKYWTIIDEPTLIAKYVFDKSIHNNCIPEFNTEFEGYFIEDEVVEGNNEVTRTIESCGILPTKIRFSTRSQNGQVLDGREKALLELLYINISNLTTEAQMFQSCINLTYVNTENMINLHQTNHMFCDCPNLTSLDVSNFDTSNVTRMDYMFCYCGNLTTLDLSSFNTSNVTNMDCMFHNCNNLTTLDLSSFNTSNVTNMHGMFYYCYNLTSLDVSNWDTSKVTTTTSMFANTPLLTDISVLYMDKSSLQKLVDAMPTDSNKTLWYKDVNIDGITHGNNITLKKYMEENVEIVLNSPLLEGDRIEVKDGKLCHVHRSYLIKNLDELDITSHTGGVNPSNTMLFRLYLQRTNTLPTGIQYGVFSDKFKKILIIWSKDKEGIAFDDFDNQIIDFRINKSKLSTQNIAGFKQWLQANPTTVVYELATPYYEDITNLQSAPTLKTYLECSMEIDTDLPIDTNVTYRTNLSSVYVMERELDELDNGTDLGDILEGEVNE